MIISNDFDFAPTQGMRARIEPITAGAGVERFPAHIVTTILPIEKGIREELHLWHASLPIDQINAYTVSLSADLQRVTWAAAGLAAPLARALRSYLENFPISEGNLEAFNEAVRLAHPEQIGSWVTALPTSFELGWYLRPYADSFVTALTLLPPSDDLEAFSRWARRVGVRECPRLGRSLVTDEEMSEVFLRVPGAAPADALDAAMQLFEVFDQDPPSPAVYALLREYAQLELFASLWLGRRGIARLGLILAAPPTGLVLHMLDAVGQTHDERLAVFESLLDSGGPAYLEYQVLASGESAELHYDLG